MNLDEVQAIVQELFASLENRVITFMETIPPSVTDRVSGPDSPWSNPWLEYAAQIQGRESYAFPLYVGLIEDQCDRVTAALSPYERRLLWLDSAHYLDWTDDSTPVDGELQEAVASELVMRVNSRAADWDLEPI